MERKVCKILSMVCALALIISLCPAFSVVAAEGVLSSLTAEKLAVSSGVNQIPTSIVTDLFLPNSVGDNSITWESNNEKIISNGGVVTRPITEDATVTLTATADNGDTKNFVYTVKAKTTNIIAQDSFAYSNDANWLGYLNAGTPWLVNTIDSKLQNSIETDVDVKYANYAKLDLDNVAATYRKKDFNAKGDTIYVDFDVKVPIQNNYDFNFYVTLNGRKKADDTPAVYSFGLVRFTGTVIRMVGENRRLTGNNDTSFHHIKAKIDLKNKNISLFLDEGNELGPYSISLHKDDSAANLEKPNDGVVGDITSDDYVFDGIESINLRRTTSSKAAGYVYLDNFSISTVKTVEELLPTLSAEEKLAYIAEKLEEDFPLSDTATLNSATQLTLNTYNGLVSWTDGTGNDCSGQTVTLTQNDTTFNTGRYIATIALDGMEPKTYTYRYAVLPKNTSVRTRTIGDVISYAEFSFDNAWRTPGEMGNSFSGNTPIEFKIKGNSNETLPEGVTWTSALETESELANKVGKFENNSDTRQTVAVNAGGGTQTNMRLQVGADFKLSTVALSKDDASEFTFTISANGTTVGIPFDADNGTFTLTERSNDLTATKLPNLVTTYQMKDYGVDLEKWNRIEVDVNNAGFVYDVYLNGRKVNETPLNYGIVHATANYFSNPVRFVEFNIPSGSTMLVDNFAIAETATTGAISMIDAAIRRLERNFATDSSFYYGEPIYNNLLNALPYAPYPSNSSDAGVAQKVEIEWTLDNNTLSKVDGSVLLKYDGMAEFGTHTLKAKVSYDDVVSETRTWNITIAPVTVRTMDINIPEVKMGPNVSGKLFVAKYTDETKRTIENVKIYNYVNGISSDLTNNAFDLEKDAIGENVGLFFLADTLKPLAYCEK